MTKLNETRLAYDRVKALLDQQLLEKKGSAQQIKDCQSAVNAAFYLLGWAQFEFLTRKEAEERIEADARAKTVHGIGWRYVLANIKAFSLRKKLEVIFFADPVTLNQLNRDYDLRNETAHNYKKLPTEVSDVSAWLDHLESLANKFQS
ncbi:hypothetical protein IP86_08360 [Rhodopseudomonas sp. AAP120]|uniref:hypothetical protein n=1 Tax=Rhodopseudomonas sp. AAP120 TaxID=1523430 RepID=UPI0006B9D3FE|nr:hypothetical protein [Rhodopseudomonas sp. AAP120]KPF99809.1 hypothetical protein IP86_08360 [Rhodopseudomonas sp. AAP120]